MQSLQVAQLSINVVSSIVSDPPPFVISFQTTTKTLFPPAGANVGFSDFGSIAFIWKMYLHNNFLDLDPLSYTMRALPSITPVHILEKCVSKLNNPCRLVDVKGCTLMGNGNVSRNWQKTYKNVHNLGTIHTMVYVQFYWSSILQKLYLNCHFAKKESSNAYHICSFPITSWTAPSRGYQQPSSHLPLP